MCVFFTFRHVSLGFFVLLYHGVRSRLRKNTPHTAVQLTTIAEIKAFDLCYFWKNWVFSSQWCTQRQTWAVSSSKSKKQNKTCFPTYPSWCLAWFVLSATGLSAARPIMELNGISFAFGSYSSELFSTEDKNSKSWPFSSAPPCESSSWRCSDVPSKISIHQSPVDSSIFKLRNTSERLLHTLPQAHKSCLNFEYLQPRQ